MRLRLRVLCLAALCLAARATPAQVRRAPAPARQTARAESPECRRCVADARTCLDDGDVPCALEVLAECRACGARRSPLVPPSHRRGVAGALAYWTGAPGEPAREELLALQAALRERAERCRASLPALVSERDPIEVAFAPAGAATHVHLTVESIGTEAACLTAAVRSALRVRPFPSRSGVVVRYPLDAAAWRRARPLDADAGARADAATRADASAP